MNTDDHNLCLSFAAGYYDVPVEALHEPKGCHKYARPRQLAQYLLHTSLGWTMTDIGNYFQRDRVTVLYAVHTIEDLRDDEEFDQILNDFEKELQFKATGEVQ